MDHEWADCVLIESDWNLKLGATSGGLKFNYGINRIRLEFKGAYLDTEQMWETRINRIRLEFKGR